jgi:hypothetical protein
VAQGVSPEFSSSTEKKKKGGSGEGLVEEVQEKEAADQWEAYESLKEPLKVILEKKTDKSIP